MCYLHDSEVQLVIWIINVVHPLNFMDKKTKVHINEGVKSSSVAGPGVETHIRTVFLVHYSTHSSKNQ